MKTILCITLLAFTLSCQKAEQQPEQQTKTTALQTDKEKISYAIGVNMAQSISDIKDEIDLSILQKGMTDKMQGNNLLVSTEEAQPLLQSFSEKLMAREQEKLAKASQENLEAGKAYLEKNKTQEGVKTTESGLQYKVLKEGEGKSPGVSDRVRVHYEGTKLDGTVFDSSYKRGEPATFPADQVIKGWTEGLQLMKVGGKYRLFIPADLAYGARGAGQEIGPNEALQFDVELLEVLDNEPQKMKPE
ncbi:MAG: FKBP-type peptidyl-prolyl cis-trans isomerase [Deltaproteobacteria bacterium]|nr:FKBP-type peptidyl-prolyl cis-trans isomerase [Deltaproteobacteria bacterium]